MLCPHKLQTLCSRQCRPETGPTVPTKPKRLHKRSLSRRDNEKNTFTRYSEPFLRCFEAQTTFLDAAMRVSASCGAVPMHVLRSGGTGSLSLAACLNWYTKRISSIRGNKTLACDAHRALLRTKHTKYICKTLVKGTRGY